MKHLSLKKALKALLLLGVWLSPLLVSSAQSAQGRGKEIAWVIGYDPKTFDPAKVDDQASELVRYLTGGVLLRLNRSTLRVEPALAESWTVSPDGRLVTFHLRPDLHFSDGTLLTATDVVATLRRVLLPATRAPVAEEFLQPAKVSVDSSGPAIVRVHLPERITSIGSVFDEIAIEPSAHLGDAHITAGPFTLAEYKRGQSVYLARNRFYWQHAPDGTPLPRLDSLRLDVLDNRETEELRFARGEYALLQDVPADGFAALSRRTPGAVHDLGPSLNTEQMWFNQAPAAPIPAWEKSWFINPAFRQAVSEAIHRADLARIAYLGHATPANGFISPANTVWYNHELASIHENPTEAQNLLAKVGFRKQGNQLFDRDGHPVKFSLLTNTGNQARTRMAALIQTDLAALGIRVNVVTLDFPALIERLMHTGDYEAALLGLSGVQPDPSTMMNIWLSSSPNHQWNPSEKTPATPWEAEIDRLMKTQAEAGDLRARQAAVNRVQTIVGAQQPFIYLVYPNVLCAASPNLQNLHLTVLQPDVVSEIETISLKGNSY